MFATLNFLFIVGFIQVFPLAFGAENTIVAIIMTILMGICAGKDVSAAPVKNFLGQTLIFSVMSVAACFSVAWGPWIAIPVNLIVIFGILYAYTFEYSNHLYFPYILSYLFLLFISPVAPASLPMRLLSVLASSACMILYALVLGYRNVKKPMRKCLCKLFDEAALCAELRSAGSALPDNAQKVREIMREFSAHADKLRKGKFELPENVFSLIDVGRGMENLILYIQDPIWETIDCDNNVWLKVVEAMRAFGLYLEKKAPSVPETDEKDFEGGECCGQLYRLLCFTRNKLLNYFNRDKIGKRESIAGWAKLKKTLDYSPVRLVYAVRVALLLTMFIIPVQFLGLEHGKWLIFTLASVSLPYAEDVRPKAAKRLAATLIGGAVATVLFSMISNSTARIALMMLSGYLSFYFSGYTGNYACATIGALGGAVIASFGWQSVGLMFGIRLSYIAIGIAIAYCFNALLCPFHRKRASEYIFRKYDATSRLLADVALSESHPQIYYGLVVENNMLEEKLLANAKRAGIENLHELTSAYQIRILKEHHRIRSNKNTDSCAEYDVKNTT